MGIDVLLVLPEFVLIGWNVGASERGLTRLGTCGAERAPVVLSVVIGQINWIVAPEVRLLSHSFDHLMHSAELVVA